jgi:hypothetical protein
VRYGHYNAFMSLRCYKYRLRHNKLFFILACTWYTGVYHVQDVQAQYYIVNSKSLMMVVLNQNMLGD